LSAAVPGRDTDGDNNVQTRAIRAGPALVVCLHRVRALGPGAVTVTAVPGTLRALAEFTVAPGRTLADGTTRWTVQTAPQRVLSDTIYTHPTADGPDLFTIARGTANGDVVMTALTTEPRLLWIESPAIREDESIVDFMGEEFGGVLLKVDGAMPPTSAIVRVGRPSEGRLWRYESVGRITKGFAQGWDATVYFVEVMPDGFQQFVGLDGATGSVKFRWPIPRSTISQLTQDCSTRRSGEMPARVGRTSVPDGEAAAFTFVVEEESRATAGCGDRTRWSRTLHLARVTPAGDVQLRPLKVFGDSGRGTDIKPRMVIPHYLSAVLAPWTETHPDGAVSHVVARIAGESSAQYTLPFLGELGIGDDTAYTVTDDERTLVVFDPTSGQVRFVRHVGTGIVSVKMVTADGGLVLFTTGQLLDENLKPVPQAPPKR
jgi:hypothetical protein